MPYPYMEMIKLYCSKLCHIAAYLFVGCTGRYCGSDSEGTLPADEGHQTIMGNLEI